MGPQGGPETFHSTVTIARGKPKILDSLAAKTIIVLVRNSLKGTDD
jgi:hypothetical protein